MKTSDFDYNLPEERIAQYPVAKRGGTRLLVLDRNTGAIDHRLYKDLPEYLRAEDVVVLNRTKVMKARVHGVVERTGRTVEVLFLERIVKSSTGEPIESWHCLIGRAKNSVIGDKIVVANGEILTVTNRCHDDPRFVVTGAGILKIMERYGKIPLPPYIKRETSSADEKRYNTIFGTSLYSAAAPTASINLTSALLKNIRSRCRAVCTVDLHIGLGTFRPIDTEEVESFTIHSEYISVPRQTVAYVNACRGRVWAFGTTVVRALESVATGYHTIRPYEGETNLFIYPGYSFQVIDVLVTNFHMPRTSLMTLVSAFAGKEKLLNSYEVAKDRKYLFLSYGDSMLVGDFIPGT